MQNKNCQPKRRLRRKCDQCHKVFDAYKQEDALTAEGNFVTWAVDPFAVEIADDYTKYWICGECLVESAQDI